MSDNNEFQENYSDDSFWDKLTNFAKKAGLEVVEKALLLYYAAQEEATPLWAKTAIYGALGYFISPIDAIPDLTPVVGYSDDLGVLVLAIAAAASYINDNVREKAATKLKDWFG
jgi:uncharacterized membrane protein YkvA (DUF1232 family)